MVEYFELVCDEASSDVVLVESGRDVVEVVKVLRRYTGLSLWHSKLLTRDVPATVLEDVSPELADAVVAVLREAGAVAEARQKPV
ncbi:ribosomal protein L7/L12 [Streptomyces sp. NPDC059649]|uniref:ribosomal protein L7/L12 n=1 Tax=unclassified Streptomyces TaxID=2593676 RepID=UPI0036834E95